MNVTGWMPPIDAIIEAAHDRGIPTLIDAAQLAPHRPLPTTADYLVWSGHKMYAPFGAGILLGPRQSFADGDPFLAGGGAVDLVDLDEVAWTDPPEREEAGSPNVIGAVALHAAIDEMRRIGWDAIAAHDRELSARLRRGLAAIDGVSLLGPDPTVETLPVATFTISGLHHALVAARLSVEHGIGVRHGCFCAHPYLLRLLHLTPDQVVDYHAAVRAGDRRATPGAIRASGGLSTSTDDIDRLLVAVGRSSPTIPVSSATSKTHIPGISGRPANTPAGPPTTERSAPRAARLTRTRAFLTRRRSVERRATEVARGAMCSPR